MKIQSASRDHEQTASVALEGRERPILFSAPMVRALLAGTKTQTRRVVKPRPPTEKDFPHSVFGMSPAVADGIKMYSMDDYERLAKHPTEWELFGSVGVARDGGFPKRYRCPYGAPGDRLWVREAWAGYREKVAGVRGDVPIVAYRATDEDDYLPGMPWRPSIYMPRWASRITLRVTDVRVERLNDISEADALAEGALPSWRDGTPIKHDGTGAICREAYAELWEHINGPGSWAGNPWVWVVSFERLGPPAEGDSSRDAK